MRKRLLLMVLCIVFLAGLMSPCAYAGSASLDTVVAALQKPFQAETTQNPDSRFSSQIFPGGLPQLAGSGPDGQWSGHGAVCRQQSIRRPVPLGISAA